MSHPDRFEDERAEFLIAVGDLCSAAERAGLEVDVVTESGGRMTGVPSAVHGAESGPEAVDDTGYARSFYVGGALVELDAIVGCSVSAPRRAR